jgi:hypothetical protein
MIKTATYISFAFQLTLLGCVSRIDTLALPPTWTDDLVITVYDGGGMLYQSLDISCTADSCRYDSMNQGIHKIQNFALSAEDKQSILKQLHDYGLGNVWSIPTKGVVYDKATQRICVTQKTAQHCVEDSAAQSIGLNGNGFFRSHDYLIEFAKKRTVSAK